MIRPKSNERIARIVLLAGGDAFLSWAALASVVWLRRSVDIPLTRALLSVRKFPLDGGQITVFVASFLLALAATGFYSLSSSPRHRPSLLITLPLQLAMLAIAGTLLEQPWPRSVFLAAPLLEAIGIRLWRAALRRFLAVRPRKVALLGTAAEMLSFNEHFAAHGDERLEIGSLVSLDRPIDHPAFGGLFSEPDGRSLAARADELIDLGGMNADTRRLELLALRGTAGFLFVPTESEAILVGERFGNVADRLLCEVRVGAATGIGRRLKRGFDLIVGSILLIASLPLLGLIAMVILIESGRPVLLRQERLGQRGRIFGLLKFRTMYRSVDAMTRASDGDRRVTTAGRLLRRYRLDELPQLWNVLAGSMSMVGPRPEMPEISRAISQDVPFFELRLLVPPGLAGLAQVSGEYDQSSHTKLGYDLQYACSWSLFQDIRILGQAIATVLSGRGV